MKCSLFAVCKSVLPHRTVRAQMTFWVGLLVVCIVGGLAAAMLTLQAGTFRTMDERMAELTTRLRDEGSRSLKTIAANQEGYAAAALRAKAASLGGLLEKLAVVPLLTFETDSLDTYCARPAPIPTCSFATS